MRWNRKEKKKELFLKLDVILRPIDLCPPILQSVVSSLRFLHDGRPNHPTQCAEFKFCFLLKGLGARISCRLVDPTFNIWILAYVYFVWSMYAPSDLGPGQERHIRLHLIYLWSLPMVVLGAVYSLHWTRFCGWVWKSECGLAGDRNVFTATFFYNDKKELKMPCLCPKSRNSMHLIDHNLNSIGSLKIKLFYNF